jgi:hypothetical protein
MVGDSLANSTRRDRFTKGADMECGWVKSPSGRGAEVKWNTQDKCVYWNGHYIGKAKTAEEAVAKTRTWITEHHIR